MSDPQQPAPSSYYATTRLDETELPSPTPPPTPAKRGRGWLYAGIGILLILAIGAGFFFVLGRTLFQAQREIPKLIGNDTQIYVSLTPNLSAIQGVQRLQSAYPQLFIEQDSSTIDEGLTEAMGVTFKEDVQPWIGTEMAIAVNGITAPPATSEGPLSESSAEELASEANVAIILSSRDSNAAQAFLDKQRTNREGMSQQFSQSEHGGITIYEQQDADQSPIAAFAMVQNYVVFASNASTVNSIIDRGSSSADTLADSARFKDVLANLPTGAIAYMYLDGASLGGLVKSSMEGSLSELGDAQSQQLEEQLANIEAWQGMGLAVSADPEGLQFDTTVNFDTSKFTPDVQSQLEEAKTAADTERLKNISDKAIGLVTFRIPSTFKDQIMKTINEQEEVASSLSEFESQVGLSLEQDLLSWLAGDVSLVVLPGDQLGDVTLPATGYFAIKPLDKAAAEKGVAKIGVVLEQVGGSQGIAFEEEELGGVTWQVIKEPQSNQTLGGYGFAGDEFVIAFGSTALESAGGQTPSIVDSANFKLVNGKLANPNAGIFYMDVTKAVEIADQLGVGAEGTPEEEEFRKNIAPIKAVGFAAAPGLDDKGAAKARLFIYIGEN